MDSIGRMSLPFVRNGKAVFDAERVLAVISLQTLDHPAQQARLQSSVMADASCVA